jgi:Domain of unknown function (DUF1917)
LDLTPTLGKRTNSGIIISGHAIDGMNSRRGRASYDPLEKKSDMNAGTATKRRRRGQPTVEHDVIDVDAEPAVDESPVHTKEVIDVDAAEGGGAAGIYRAQIDVSGWVIQPEHIDPMDFALSNLPSTWNPEQVAWINLKNCTSKVLGKGSGSPSVTKSQDDYKFSGKWMWFVRESVVDEKFIMLAEALRNGQLGDSLKVPPVSCEQRSFGSTGDTASEPLESQPKMVPFIIYTKDFRDRDDVLRVGLALKRIAAIETTISYKPGEHQSKHPCCCIVRLPVSNEFVLSVL